MKRGLSESFFNIVRYFGLIFVLILGVRLLWLIFSSFNASQKSVLFLLGGPLVLWVLSLIKENKKMASELEKKQEIIDGLVSESIKKDISQLKDSEIT